MALYYKEGLPAIFLTERPNFRWNGRAMRAIVNCRPGPPFTKALASNTRHYLTARR